MGYVCMCLFTLKVGFEQRLLYSSINTFLDHDDDHGNRGARKNGKIEPLSLLFSLLHQYQLNWFFLFGSACVYVAR